MGSGIWNPPFMSARYAREVQCCVTLLPIPIMPVGIRSCTSTSAIGYRCCMGNRTDTNNSDKVYLGSCTARCLLFSNALFQFPIIFLEKNNRNRKVPLG